MIMHQVEVDNEVFLFVKSHAEPLVDTFNSALKRLLPIPAKNTREIQLPKEELDRPKSIGILPSFGSRIPKSLQQILGVIHLVKVGVYTRVDATKFLAKQYKVFPQTVIDKYTRQLHLTAGEFDRLLEQADLAGIGKILEKKFPRYVEVIDEVLNKE